MAPCPAFGLLLVARDLLRRCALTHHSELAALLDDAVEDGIGADVRPHHAVHSADAVHRGRRRVVLRKHPRLGTDGRRRGGVELLSQEISTF